MRQNQTRGFSLFLVVFVTFWVLCPNSIQAQEDGFVEVLRDSSGWKIRVDSEPFFVYGMNWDYIPIGSTYRYRLFEQSPDVIKNVLDHDMPLLRAAGVNAIRVYTGIQRNWIEYIYDTYGIYTMLNHTFGRYGLTIDGQWMGNTDYSDPRVAERLLSEVEGMVREFKGTRGLLLYLLGNENNYGLFWRGAETEQIPVEDRQSTIQARHMYRLFNRGIRLIKSIDTTRPVGIANGDLQFLDIIVEETPDMDILGANVYRGPTFTNLYDRVAAEFDKPVLLTEFGADAYNVRLQREDQRCQAEILRDNWYDIFRHAAGMDGAKNSIGGFTFQFSDGWWKYNQEEDLDVHNTNASWANGGYRCDYISGQNNMNEEWFGIMAKGPLDNNGVHTLRPRASYYLLKEVHKFFPFGNGITQSGLELHFRAITVEEAIRVASGSN
jgi:hypothetical protein